MIEHSMIASTHAHVRLQTIEWTICEEKIERNQNISAQKMKRIVLNAV